jgi:hypothetical protein
MRVRQVVYAGNHRCRPHLAIRDHAANADAAKPHAVIAALAPDEPHARRVALRAVIRQGNLERRVDRLDPELVKNTRSRPAGAIFTTALARSKARRMAHLERRRVVHGFELDGHGLRDFESAHARR